MNRVSLVFFWLFARVRYCIKDPFIVGLLRRTGPGSFCMIFHRSVLSLGQSSRRIRKSSNWDFYSPARLLTGLALRALVQRFNGRGRGEGTRFWENYFIWVKWSCGRQPLRLFFEKFFQAYSMPFRLYPYKRSNRSYLVPVPFQSESGARKYTLMILRQQLKNRREATFLDRFFSELLEFLRSAPESRTILFLNDQYSKGVQNRTFLHFRW